MLENVKIDIREESEQIKRIFQNKDMVSIEDLIQTIEELDDEIEHLEEEKKELEEYYQENYNPKHYDAYEEYGVSRSDFC